MVTYQVSASADDGFAQSAAAQDTTASYLKIGDERTYAIPYQMSAMRFNDVDIPRSATITSAYLKITSINTDYRGQIYGVIAAEASDNPADFSGRLIGNAVLTAASVVWDRKTAWSPDTQYISPDISNVIQEVVNRPGFGSGNSIAVYYSTRALSGKARSFASYEYSPSSVAVLEITYETYTISGHILTTEATGLENVAVSAGANIEGDVTDASGYYELKVPLNWSGTVTPSKADWGFSPVNQPYSNVNSDQVSEDYTAFKPNISGYVKDGGGASVEGVLVSADNGGGSYITNTSGYYEIIVPYDWSGTVTPNRLGWGFTPSNRSYSNVTADQIDQDFTAVYVGIIVKPDGTGDYPTIQTAIDAAINGDIVELQTGTYTGDGNRNIYFLGKAITVRGATGNPNDVIIDCQGTQEDPHRGFNFVNGEDANSILECLTITNGYSPQEDIEGCLRYVGGAVFCKNSDPTIDNCVFNNNFALNYGGAVYSYNSNPTLNNCFATGNYASTGGGGLYNYYSSPMIQNCVISDNSTGRSGASRGGGICNLYSEPVITDCIINNNTAYYNGGGIHNLSSNLTISNCDITNNSAIYDAGGWDGSRGGGIHHESGNLVINNCRINSNTVKGCSTLFFFGGGGIYNLGNATISNSVIRDNFVSHNSSCSSLGYYKGGGICNSGNMLINNCTIIYNLMADSFFADGGGIYSSYSNSLTITNSIIWGNQVSEIYGTWVTVSYSNVGGGYEGIGNINEDPEFIDQFHLSSSSQCLNTGDPNYIPDSNETDIDSDPRIVGMRIDIGADEFASENPFIVLSDLGFSFSALEARDNPAPATAKLNNLGLNVLNWTTSSNAAWLTITPTSGVLNYDEMENLSITADINGLSAGEYYGQISIDDPQAVNGPKVIDVHLAITGPSLGIDLSNFSFQASKETLNPEPQALTISNLTGGGTLSWNITSDCNWMSIEPISGAVTTGSVAVMLDIDQNNIDYGNHNCQLLVEALDAGNSPQIVNVDLQVLRPMFSTNQSIFNFTAEGLNVTVPDQILNITNTGHDTLDWHIEMPNDYDWLGISPLLGQTERLETDNVILSIDNNSIDYGTYSCQLQVSDPNAENSPQTVSVNFEVLGPKINLSKTNYYFYAYGKSDDDVADQQLMISNAGYDTLNWHIEIPNDCNWLTVTPQAGSVTDGNSTVILSVEPNKAPEYGYNYCTLQIIDPNASNSPQVVEVRLNVYGPTLSISPSALNIYAEKDKAAESAFVITNTGYGVLDWTIEVPNDCNWITWMSPISGSCSRHESIEVTVTVDANGLDADTTDDTHFWIHSPQLGSPKVSYIYLHVYEPNEIHVPYDYPTLQQAVDAAQVYGDTIIVHPGKYAGCDTKGKSLTITSLDPNNPSIVAATIIGSGISGIYGIIYKDATGFLELKGLSIIHDPEIYSSNYTGIVSHYGNTYIKNCTIKNWPEGGVNIWAFRDIGKAMIENCLISGNKVAGILTQFRAQNLNIDVNNCTITNTLPDIQGDMSGIRMDGYDNIKLNINNSILSNCKSPNDVEIAFNSIFSREMNYLEISNSCLPSGPNGIFIADTNYVNVSYGPGNIEADPCFVKDGYLNDNNTPSYANDDYWVEGDYHLKSQYGYWQQSSFAKMDADGDGFLDMTDFAVLAGEWGKTSQKQTMTSQPYYDYYQYLRADLDDSGTVDVNDLMIFCDNYLYYYDYGQWVNDNVTSPCIDAGDPNSDWTAELWPHGKCINMGAYGGTAEASMSNSTVGNIANLDNDANDVVDYNDLDIFVKKWCYEESLLAEDLNRDGVVNCVDYGIFANNWLAGTMP